MIETLLVPKKVSIDLDQLVFEPTTPGVTMLQHVSPDDPNEILLGDDEIDDFDEILSEDDSDENGGTSGDTDGK